MSEPVLLMTSLLAIVNVPEAGAKVLLPVITIPPVASVLLPLERIAALFMLMAFATVMPFIRLRLVPELAVSTLVPSAVALPTTSVPPLIVVVPVRLLLLVSVNVPLPVLVRLVPVKAMPPAAFVPDNVSESVALFSAKL